LDASYNVGETMGIGLARREQVDVGFDFTPVNYGSAPVKELSYSAFERCSLGVSCETDFRPISDDARDTA
jgi:hypothetical protein